MRLFISGSNFRKSEIRTFDPFKTFDPSTTVQLKLKCQMERDRRGGVLMGYMQAEVRCEQNDE